MLVQAALGRRRQGAGVADGQEAGTVDEHGAAGLGSASAVHDRDCTPDAGGEPAEDVDHSAAAVSSGPLSSFRRASPAVVSDGSASMARMTRSRKAASAEIVFRCVTSRR